MSIAVSRTQVYLQCKIPGGPFHATSLAQANVTVWKQQYSAPLLSNRAHLASFRMFGQIAISTVLAVAASAGPSLVQRAPTPSPINLGIP